MIISVIAAIRRSGIVIVCQGRKGDTLVSASSYMTPTSILRYQCECPSAWKQMPPSSHPRSGIRGSFLRIECRGRSPLGAVLFLDSGPGCKSCIRDVKQRPQPVHVPQVLVITHPYVA